MPAEFAKRFRHRLLPALAVALLVAWPMIAGPADASAGTWRTFGQTGKLFTNFKPIPQWSTLLKRYQEEEERNTGCRAGKRGNCPYTEWRAMIERLQGQDRRTQVDEINRFANNWRYVTDPINWGVEDYWSTPGEFFAKAGDCEDYAIVKFMSLRALGFRNDEVRLVAVMDLNLDVGHAVALVNLGGRILLLDNQIKKVIDADSVRHYKPVFSANENAWWLYK
ncbi:transglutaminase-like cysteine peptidase [Thiocystis violacea]|uniref:transglutaminase-like cysteine peptidase n=1 Tax=Thiocystis violacea TaxID=13725 RepID=UPI0019049CB7|nr:transglutaminase-like cysteine peptidase [Thiocystis violacea]MBK1719633.1 hypothetical protein [Thiocystis violacea]